MFKEMCVDCLKVTYKSVSYSLKETGVIVTEMCVDYIIVCSFQRKLFVIEMVSWWISTSIACK